MKKILSLFALFLLLMAWGCENDGDNVVSPDDEKTEHPNNDAKDELPIFEIDGEGVVEVEAIGGRIEFTATTNLEYTIEIPEDASDWLTLDETRTIRTETIVLTVAKNESTEGRSAIVSILDSKGTKRFSVTIKQKGAEEENPDDGKEEEDSDPDNPLAHLECAPNEILYTTKYDLPIELGNTQGFGGNLVYNTYENGVGKLTFGNDVVAIPSNAFNGCNSMMYIKYPDSITSIEDSAFLGCSSLKSITIPEGITSIKDSAFLGCTSLTNITIPEGVTSIGYSAFGFCENLTTLVIPDTVFSIGDRAFIICSNIKSIHIGGSVSTIGDYAFSGCNSLSKVYCATRIPPKMGLYAFDQARGEITADKYTVHLFSEKIGCKIYVPASSVHDYKTTYGWYSYASDIVGYAENNKIYYTNDSKTEPTEPKATAFGGANIVSNTYNAKAKSWIIEFDGEVTSIGDCAFENCRSLTSIIIPDSVTSIGVEAFENCTSLTSITIPDSVTSIGVEAFYNCDSLTSVTIGNGVTFIGNYAFSRCSRLASITIPDSVTSIGDHAFEFCISLTSIIIPDSVTSIGDGAFHYCESLTSITIPDSVTSIGKEAFWECYGLASITIGNGVTSIGDWAFSLCNNLANIIVSEGNSVYDSRDNCNAIIETATNTLVQGCNATTIPDGVTSIGDYAFCNCESLTSITIPDSVTSIGYWAFSGCNNLANIIVSEGNSVYDSRDNCNAIIETATNTLVQGCNATTIPDSVTSIGYGAFYDCRSLTSIIIPDSVTSIRDWAFAYCTSLTSIIIPDSVTSIGYGAFHYCKSLTSITIPDSVTSIGVEAFCNCESLTSITIPDGITSIGMRAFCFCHSLTSVYCEATTPPEVGWDMFDDNAPGRKIYVPTASVNAYKNADGWKEYASDIVGYDFDTGVAVEAPESWKIYYTNGSKTEPTEPYATDVFGANIVSNTYNSKAENWVIEFDGEVTSIGDGAFYNCTSLTSITIPDSVTSIGVEAFFNCYSLTSVTIPDSVTSIGVKAFSWCNNLANIIVSEGNSVYDSRDNCNAIIETATNTLVQGCNATTIPDGVTSIGDCAFEYCRSLTSIIIPDSVTSIGDCAFYDCTSLTSITIPDGITTIGMRAFFNCESLTSITIPDSVTSIGLETFCVCDSLTSVTIGNGVTSIEGGAFSGCASLTSITITEGNSVYDSRDNCNAIIETATNTLVKGCNATTIPDSVTSIGDCAFYNCTSLTSITIPDSVTSIGVEAFFNCYSLTSITIGNGVTSIGDHAFEGCTGELIVNCNIPDARQVNWDMIYSAFAYADFSKVIIGEGVTYIGVGAFCNCESLTSVTIPDSVTTIGSYAFSRCSSLASITIPDSVTSIGVDAFCNCAGLTSITIGNGVTSIGDGIFYNCTSLTSVTIPNSVTAIGVDAFGYCTSLTSITIPYSVTSIGDRAFANCSSLKKVFCRPTTPPERGWDMFDDNASGRKIYVPTASVNAYKNADGWKEYASDIVNFNF